MENAVNAEVLKIDVDAVLRQRLPRYYKLIPAALVAWLKRTIHQEELNNLLERNAGKEGADFCRCVLRDLDVSYQLAPGCELPEARNHRVIYISNHPLGGLDGIALIDMVASHHGVEPWFVVNDLLMAVKPLQRVFLPVNKHGRQSRAESDVIDRALRSDRPVIIFPAGLVSRRSADGTIADLEWKKRFVNMAIRYGRDIIPLYFSGQNSRFFYNFAKLRTRIGLKFNIEMIYLPDELMKARHSRFTISAGSPVSHTTLEGGARAASEAARLREIVYGLSPITQEPWNE